MQSQEKKPDAADSAKTVAAIDVGANALRMVIAEVLPDGRIEVLERLQRAVRLGQDTFRRGRLGAESMRAALAVLRDYRQLLDLYKVEQVRAVATSAVREAGNADTFLDRVFMATGLNVEVIDTSEESRLTVSAVRQAVGDALGVNQRQTLIADVGGGSTLLTLLGRRRDRHLAEPAAGLDPAARDVLHQRGIAAAVGRDAAPAHRQRAVDAAELAAAWRASTRSWPSGATPASPPAKSASPPNRPTWWWSSRPSSTSWWTAASGTRPRSCRSATACPSPRPRRSTRPCWSTRSCLQQTKAEQMIVSHVSMRDGLLLELAREVTGKEDRSLLEGVIHSAMAIAEKYRVDLEHARAVAEVAVRLFDELPGRPRAGPAASACCSAWPACCTRWAASSAAAATTSTANT